MNDSSESLEEWKKLGEDFKKSCEENKDIKDIKDVRKQWITK